MSEEQNGEKVAELFSFVEKFCYLFNSSPQLGVNVSFFSDSIILSADELHKLIFPISIAESYLKSELNLLFRGGITKGKYYHSKGITFGPAVVAAYHLEKQANYSRILIDKSVGVEHQEYIEFFRDTDGKLCLNLSALIVFNGTEFGNKEIVYPNGNPGETILKIFREEREAILSSIKDYYGTSVVEKYIWRVRPFNYSCEKIADNPYCIEMFKELNYTASDSFKSEMLKLRINNFDY